MIKLDIKEIYNESLEIYHNSEQYRRELALNCVGTIIPIFEDSPYYSLGIRGIDVSNIACYTLYIDVSLIFSSVYNGLGSDVFLFVISNDYGIMNKEISYNHNLFFSIDMSSFHYILDMRSANVFKYITLHHLVESNINLVYKNNKLSLYLHSNDIPLENDIRLFNYLFRFIDREDFEVEIFGGLVPEHTLRYLSVLFSYISVYPVTINYNPLRSSYIQMGDDWELLSVQSLEEKGINQVSNVVFSSLFSESYSYGYIKNQSISTIQSFQIVNKRNDWFIGANFY